MYHKDYILRMIEMVGQIIAAILGNIKGGDYEKPSELLSNLYYDVLREDAAYFRTLTEEDMTKKLLEEHNYTNGHLEILAELFNAEAELSMAKGANKESIGYSQKSLILFIKSDVKL